MVHVWHRHGLATQAGSQASSPSGYSPAVLEKAYDFSASDHGTGTGKTIGIVDAYDDPTIASNLSTFSSEYGLPACTSTNGCFTKVNQSGGTSYPKETKGWDVEISLDVEWAHAIAPKADILLVEASSTSDTNLFTAVKYAAAHAQYVSMSWGGDEFSGETALDGDFTSNVSFFAAAGDSASEVIYPSSSPKVISVGGTSLTVQSTGTWKAESAWATGGGGCSKYENASSAQAAFPTYDQSGASCSGMRATPDVALDANPNTGVSIYDSIDTPDFGSGWEVVGGTSVATPIWAAHSAAAADRVDATFVYGSNIKFYDVTSGSNGHSCVAGYNLCDGLGSWNTSVGKVNGGSAGSLSFTTSAASLTAGSSVELSVHLSSSQTAAVPVTLTSSSTAGEFSASASSGFAKSLTVTVPAHSASVSVYYEDTTAGTPTLTASSAGWTSGARSVTVNAGKLAAITLSPATVSLGEGATQTFTATAADEYGNVVSADPTWTTTVSGAKVSPTAGASTTFTAGSTAGSGTVTATEGGVSAQASVTVTSTTTLDVAVTAGSTSRSGRSYRVPLTVTTTGTAGAAVKGADVTVAVYSGSCSGTLEGSASGTSSTTGKVSFTFTTSTTGTYCAKATATASGYSAGSGTATFNVSTSEGVATQEHRSAVKQ